MAFFFFKSSCACSRIGGSHFRVTKESFSPKGHIFITWLSKAWSYLVFTLKLLFRQLNAGDSSLMLVIYKIQEELRVTFKAGINQAVPGLFS